MLPTLTFEIPDGEEWTFEVKYDGFRALLNWNETLEISSRNGKPLLALFPEISDFLQSKKAEIEPYLPLILDGEIVYLDNDYKSNFSHVQTRGRMRSVAKINEKAEHSPCHLLVFDVLVLNGKAVSSEPYEKRKGLLKTLFQDLGFPSKPDHKNKQLLQMIPSYDDYKTVWDKVTLFDGEGIVAKQRKNLWVEGKRTTTWLKFKNWKYVSCFITCFEKSNGYFYVGVYEKGTIVSIGQFLFGIRPDEKQALYKTLKENKVDEDENFIYVNPAICVQIKYLEMYEGKMREPHFDQFRFDLNPTDCTYEQFLQKQKNLPAEIEISHPNKPLWENPPIQKHEYIHYLREISPYFLPFLENRLLTVIRYPHGIFKESFYQKNTPDYAPSFVETKLEDGINYTVCNDLQTLLWLGNQLAFEFHIPFQTISNKGPSEIVFDLDPPSREYFHLAIKAALMIKEVTDQLKLISFIKTSGNKGLQIYLPLPENRYSYDETRLFTSFVADYLVSKAPDSFTIERLKKNRGNRLYIDYVQHAEGKTIIAPYSPRGTSLATVATPLNWDEVTESLTIEQFQLPNILQRVKTKGNPFQNFFQAKDEQNFDAVLEFLKKSRT